MRWDLEIENERYKAREEGRAEGRAAGLEEGRAAGLEIGFAEGESRLANLIMKLTPGTDEYQTALRGSEDARHALYEKYGV